MCIFVLKSEHTIKKFIEPTTDAQHFFPCNLYKSNHNKNKFYSQVVALKFY